MWDHHFKDNEGKRRMSLLKKAICISEIAILADASKFFRYFQTLNVFYQFITINVCIFGLNKVHVRTIFLDTLTKQRFSAFYGPGLA